MKTTPKKLSVFSKKNYRNKAREMPEINRWIYAPFNREDFGGSGSGQIELFIELGFYVRAVAKRLFGR